MSFYKQMEWIRPMLCVCLSVLLAAVSIGALPTKGEETLYDRVIRLHVLANSDSDEDQSLKLQVRDAVLAYLETASVSAGTADDAEAAYRDCLPQIEATAASVISAAGYDYSCHVTLTQETYPARQYASITLPAGTYRSLRVQIGAADGKNWWCVLFPPLCLSLAASAETENQTDNAVPTAIYDETEHSYSKEEALLAAGFTPYEVSLISGEQETKTVVKFRIVEFFRSLFTKKNHNG